MLGSFPGWSLVIVAVMLLSYFHRFFLFFFFGSVKLRLLKSYGLGNILRPHRMCNVGGEVSVWAVEIL